MLFTIDIQHFGDLYRCYVDDATHAPKAARCFIGGSFRESRLDLCELPPLVTEHLFELIHERERKTQKVPLDLLG